MTLFTEHNFGGLIVRPGYGNTPVRLLTEDDFGQIDGKAIPTVSELAALSESEVRDLIDVLQEAIAR